MVKVGGQDLYCVDEELSPSAEEVGEEEWGDEEEDDSGLEEINGPECLWRDGEYEPEGDPEEWVDRVADEVEEKGLQKMQVLEKPEGSARGISYLTVCIVYGRRRKPYQIGDGTPVKRWKRRSSLTSDFRTCTEASTNNILAKD